MPSDLGSGSLYWVWVLEDHEGLGGDALRQMLWLLSSEILLKEINLIVLMDPLSCIVDHLFGSSGETELSVSVKLLMILSNLSWLSWINLLRPSSLLMLHSLVAGWNSLCVNLFKN